MNAIGGGWRGREGQEGGVLFNCCAVFFEDCSMDSASFRI